jgi:two-component system chemotaxis response regulator CheY
MFPGKPSRGGVLIVDDEPNIRKVVRMTLEKDGYEVLEAQDGQEAMEIIQRGENPMTLNVIITDIRMPKVNGIEAMTYFKKEWPSVPLIVLTGFPDVEMATSLLQQGAFGYLVKPVEGEKLKTFVAKAIGQRTMNWM